MIKSRLLGLHTVVVRASPEYPVRISVVGLRRCVGRTPWNSSQAHPVHLWLPTDTASKLLLKHVCLF